MLQQQETVRLEISCHAAFYHCSMRTLDPLCMFGVFLCVLFFFSHLDELHYSLLLLKVGEQIED